MHLPETLLNSLTGIKGFNKEAFEDVHRSSGQVTSIRLNPLKSSRSTGLPVTSDAATTPIPWAQLGYYLSNRPSFTFDPFFHAGCYYVQEASSMFLEQAFRQTLDLSKPLKVLDLCAAPGGKTTHIQSLLSAGSLLVSNDVIKTRATILKDNCIKWGTDNIVITNNDPADFSRLPGFFDVIVVDAPCSGSGLFRRDEAAIEEWSPNNVELCSQRQQRVLADVWPSLKEGGLLYYATCSYSKQEDEDILDWITKELPVSSCKLETDKDWNIVEVQSTAGAWGYRFWPYLVKGEGFFLSCFRKTDGDNNDNFTTRNKPVFANKKEEQLIRQWFTGNDHRFIQKNNLVYAIPAALTDAISYLLTTLRVQYSGIIVGEIFRDTVAPAHPLAMSRFVNDTITRKALEYDQAIQYLKRKESNVTFPATGWALVTYEAYNLGWVKALTNRINNYYPKELRILKDR